jgi:2-C-methyl-D-erythritol 4-phosphate cytidylyltransferase
LCRCSLPVVSSDPVAVIVVAAGRGDRFGGAKQYRTLAGRRVLDWSLDAARSVADQLVLVVAADRTATPEPGADVVVAGGATRSDSVRCGLAAVAPEAAVVVVHDAARPMAPPELFRAVVDAVTAGADGAVPGVPVADTVKQVRDQTVVATLERSTLVAVQTPQAFRADVLRAAHAGGAEATDDAALVEGAGGRVVVVAGDPRNAKITAPDDLENLGRHLS